jgi:GGDEF domain-containing protein
MTPILQALHAASIRQVFFGAVDGDRMKLANAALGLLGADASLEEMTNIYARTQLEVKAEFPDDAIILFRLGGDEFEFLAFGPNAELVVKTFVTRLQSNLAASSAAGNIVPPVSGAYGPLDTSLAFDPHKLESYKGDMDAAGINLTKPRVGGFFNRNAIVGLTSMFNEETKAWVFNMVDRFLGPTFDGPPAEGDDYTTNTNKVARDADWIEQPNVTQLGPEGITSRAVMLPGVEIGPAGELKFSLPNTLLTGVLQQLYGANATQALNDLRRLT